MRIAITGTPGTGKTSLAKMLADKFSYAVINEKDFAIQNKLGSFNSDNELEIPLKEFEKKAKAFLKKNDNIIIEGHLICEAKLPVDKLIILTINPEELELRLEQRKYSPIKIMDNVFCEGIEYCKKHAKRNYSPKKIIELNSSFAPKITFFNALNALKIQK